MTEFLQKLDERIQEKHLLTHPFYQAWTQGQLDKECLRDYAKEYYHHVRAFPTYLSTLHAHTEDMATRKEILKNLIEEEAGEPNHPDLWRSFALSLGATNQEIDEHCPSPEIQHLISTFRSICATESVSEGLAALYAYESQIPAICISKIDGLKKHYGMQEPSSWKYFTVHIGADEEHARVERALLHKHINADQESSVLRAVDRVLDSLWAFLSSLVERHHIICAS